MGVGQVACPVVTTKENHLVAVHHTRRTVPCLRTTTPGNKDSPPPEFEMILVEIGPDQNKQTKNVRPILTHHYPFFSITYL